MGSRIDGSKIVEHENFRLNIDHILNNGGQIMTFTNKETGRVESSIDSTIFGRQVGDTFVVETISVFDMPDFVWGDFRNKFFPHSIGSLLMMVSYDGYVEVVEVKDGVMNVRFGDWTDALGSIMENPPKFTLP